MSRPVILRRADRSGGRQAVTVSVAAGRRVQLVMPVGATAADVIALASAAAARNRAGGQARKE